MRHIFCATALFAVVALLGGSATSAEEKKAEGSGTFFNAKDLTGWEGLKELWSVKDGALVGETAKDGLKFNTFLCSQKKYSDFELTFKVRLLNGGGNSGVQIRSKILDGENEKGKFVVAGPQCDIAKGFWASLYGEHFDGKNFGKGMMLKAAPEDVIKKVLKEADFNDYYIRCTGQHVTIKLNGATTVDDDFPGMPAEGIIAWQLHSGPHMQVTFKDIKFTDLSKK